jgi:hypothetical protein
VTSANAVVLATSPKSGATDPTDVVCNQAAGSLAAPFRSVQGALDLVTRDAVNGDQFNIAAASAQVLAASLAIDEYGTPDGNSPLVLRGYTSTANDGGVGEIDCGGVKMLASAVAYIYLGDLEIHTFGDNDGIITGTYSSVFRCDIHHGASNPSSGKYLLKTGALSSIVGCSIHSASKCRGIEMSQGVLFGNNIYDTTLAAQCTGSGCIVGNVIKQSTAGAYGLYLMGGGLLVANNSIYNSAAGTLQGITLTGTTPFGNVLVNNIVEGFSGAGGEGIELTTKRPAIVGYNAFYNNTSSYTKTIDIPFDLATSDVSLAASPFTDATNLDFSLTAAAQTALAAKGWPSSYLGAHANTVPNLNIGPIQMAAASYPAVGDVQTGVVYGGGTGTLDLPAEADVRSGTGYGEDGAEFTGTLSVTGGGGVSRVIGG